MKLSKFLNLLLMGLLCGVSAVGCKTNEKPPVTRFDSNGPNGGGKSGEIGPGGQLPPGAGGVQPGGGDAATFNPDDMNPDRSALAAQTIYFDLDSSAIRSDDQTKLEAVASALKSDASAKLLIEGDCDERGTEEYNRSLGERRALAAREALATRGVDPGRIATRSFGEDRPAATGHDESSWRKNRRDEFVLLHPR
jgi:peptidoglycan-associated lipoprotein